MRRQVVAAGLLAGCLAALPDHAPAQSRGTAASARPVMLGRREYRDSVIAAEKHFLVHWDSAWLFSERDRHQFFTFADGEAGDGSRHQNYHCHPDFQSVRSAVTQGRLIESTHGWFSVCPSFDLGEVRMPIDERLDLDDALTEPRRTGVQDARAKLLTQLDSAAALFPSDNFLAGQRVRFALDQWDFRAANETARACRADVWWCTALVGYVHAAQFEWVAADSAFAAALASMPPGEKCRWTDLHYLIDFSARDEYDRIACDKRDSVNAHLWWLADPLFIDPGNERRVEQYARTVSLSLRTELGRDERFDWNPKSGGDAREVMIVRYGWPSYTFWGGPLQDRSHTGYLAGHNSAKGEPYTTYEYFGTRVHTVPAWAAITDPFHAIPQDWKMIAAAAKDSSPLRPAPGGPSPMYATHAAMTVKAPFYWWPVEHFEPRLPLAQMPPGQQVLLRREKGALLAVATDLPMAYVQRLEGDTIPAITLVTSESPTTVNRIAERPGIVGGAVELHGLVSSKPALAGLEYPAHSVKGPPGARLRFGISPEPPLAVMATGDVAISNPVLLQPPVGEELLPSDPNSALPRMATSHVVAAHGKFGVYWETYGFAPTDSVEVAVWVERSTAQSVARRFGIALGVTPDLNTPISVTWKEPDPGHRSFVFREGNVMVVSRALTIDAAALPTGDYRLEIATRKIGKEPVVRGHTTFVVQDR